MENNSSTNFVAVEFEALPENQSFARAVCASYCARLDPTTAELAEIKTIVSEAVSNAIIHGYDRKGAGKIRMEMKTVRDGVIYIKVIDRGRGIADIGKAMEPLYSTDAEQELSGMGFTVMESFSDKVTVESKLGEGTEVTLIKSLLPRHE